MVSTACKDSMFLPHSLKDFLLQFICYGVFFLLVYGLIFSSKPQTLCGEPNGLKEPGAPQCRPKEPGFPYYHPKCPVRIDNPGVQRWDLRNWQGALKYHNIEFGSDVSDSCQSLFKGAQMNITSDSYIQQKSKFDQHLLQHAQIALEGNIHDFQEERLLYWILGNINSVSTVCEIGFNAGHSALLWLESNPNIHLYSFDINVHSYTAPMADFIKQEYPGRFDIYFGTSTLTVPAVARDCKTKCDILIVDGGHLGDQPFIDIVNMKHLAKDDSIVLVDDTAYGQLWSDPVIQAVTKLHELNFIKVQFICSHKQKLGRGIAVLNYM